MSPTQAVVDQRADTDRSQRFVRSVQRAAATVGQSDARALHTGEVAVLGAAGTIAPAIVHDLGESSEVGEMLLLDLDGERAAAVAERTRRRKGRPRAPWTRAPMTISPRSSARSTCSSTPRPIASTSTRCAPASTRAATTSTSVACTHMTLRQLELSTEFERAGLLALLGMGSSPGKTNLMAASAVARARLGADGDRGLRRRTRSARGRQVQPALRGPDAARRADHGARSAARRQADRDRAAGRRRPSRLRRADRRRRDDLHAALRARDLRRRASAPARSSFRLSLAPALLERAEGR